MRKKTQGMALAVLLLTATGSKAQVQPPVRMKLEVRVVADQAELMQLMARNSMRIYNQRMQLWQKARQQMAEQTSKDERNPDVSRNQDRYRQRHENGDTKGKKTAERAAAEPTRQNKAQARTAAQAQARNAAQAQARTAAQPRTRASKEGALKADLRKMLRQNRLKKQTRLDKKLAKAVGKKQKEQHRFRQQTGQTRQMRGSDASRARRGPGR